MFRYLWVDVLVAERRLAVVGGGWAGIAAALEAAQRGHVVTLFEMAPQLGGRSRGVEVAGHSLDNGQHILIGAYVETLALLRTVGVDPDHAFLRTPLTVTYPDGTGLRLRGGSPGPAFAAAVLRRQGWRLRERLGLLAAAAGWVASGFRCDGTLTVATLTHRLPKAIRDDLIDPLCVAALNTPSVDASARVFLRVLKDALFAAPGSADLLLPRASLSALLPEPAAHRLQALGATIRLQQRVDTIVAEGDGWRVDGERFEQVVLATTPVEAARLTLALASHWSRAAGALRYEPIVTVYLRGHGVQLAAPMLALRSSDFAPAQFVLDRGQLGGPPGLLAFVISGAQPWVERGMDAVLRATLDQARAALGLTLEHVQTLTEKRATFRCTPALHRPPMRIAAGLHAAGDYVDGPYPATLEGAVRSGLNAVRPLA
jgi:squalene-associated FAD-dependent desaturase